MQIKPWTIGLTLFCAVLAASGQMFFKLGSESTSFNIRTWVFNKYILLGIFLYATSAILFIIALKHGKLSILYPIIATSYIWVSILSVNILNESFSAIKWLGIFFIILGISLVVAL